MVSLRFPKDTREREIDKTLLRYSPSTGNLWRFITHSGPFKVHVPHWRECKGLDRRGYVAIGLGPNPAKITGGHRIAWFVMNGSWPQDQIDHIDGNRANNKWSNLRDVQHLDNHRNRRLPSNNKSGRIGVYWSNSHGKWMAEIGNGAHMEKLGGFDKKADAIAAREDAERRHGYHENHGSA